MSLLKPFEGIFVVAEKVSPFLRTTNNIAIRPFPIWRPNLVSQPYCSYYYINPQARASLFLRLLEEVDSESMPGNLPWMWWHATFNCVIGLGLLTFPLWHVCTYTHTSAREHTDTQKLADRGGRIGRVSGWSGLASKIDPRICGKVDGKGFVWADNKDDQGTGKLEDFKAMLLLKNFGTCANTHTHTHTFAHTNCLLFGATAKWSVSFKVGAFKWRPASLW